MERIGVRELREGLAAALRRAEAGERLVVTVGGRPVAQLVPLGAGPTEPTLDDLAARGLVTPPRRADRPDPAIAMPLWAGTRLDRLVTEVRGR